MPEISGALPRCGRLRPPYKKWVTRDTEAFEANRPALLALAYRMLGDVARAEDIVQDAWLRWQKRDLDVEIASPKAYLVTTVTRLCLDELDSARARREESRSDRLPEPVDLAENGFDTAEKLDRISMAFVVLLQRLTPAERAVLLLHDVFDLSHEEIAASLGKSDAASRQLLRRAREHLAKEEPVIPPPRDEHRRLLSAFIRAVYAGKQDELVALLAEDAVLIADAGPSGGRYGRIRNIGRPLVGRTRIVALMQAFAKQADTPLQEIHERTLNGEPAVIAMRDGRILAAIFVSVADGKVSRVFLQTDPARLGHVGRHVPGGYAVS
jgi:RNA polymerase sigma-70 factor (ECF subfamily)